MFIFRMDKYKRKMPNLNDDEMEVSEQNEVSYCKTCMTDARQGNRTDAERKADPKIPRYSASNNVDCDEVIYILISFPMQSG